jgi:TRAP-type uncharacterized transport system substrate-binding protein
LWWFRKREIGGVGVDALRGRKISIGPEGSGTRALALQLIRRTGMEGQFREVLPLAPRAAGEKLLAGEIDVAFMMTSWESPVVQQLLADEHIGLSGFPHADAFVALSVSEQGGGAQGRDRYSKGSTADRCGLDCNQG